MSLQSHHYELPLTLATYVSLLSLSGHKEHRFLFGVYPLIAISVVIAVSFLTRKGLYLTTSLLLFLGAFHNTSAFRQQGMYKDMGSIHLAEFMRTFDRPVSDAVLFYGCYNSPLNSVVHKPIHMDIAECLPNDSRALLGQETLEYLQQKVRQRKPQLLVLENTYLKPEVRQYV